MIDTLCLKSGVGYIVFHYKSENVKNLIVSYIMRRFPIPIIMTDEFLDNFREVMISHRTLKRFMIHNDLFYVHHKVYKLSNRFVKWSQDNVIQWSLAHVSEVSVNISGQRMYLVTCPHVFLDQVCMATTLSSHTSLDHPSVAGFKFITHSPGVENKTDAGGWGSKCIRWSVQSYPLALSHPHRDACQG